MTGWERDVQGRVTAEIFPDGTRTAFTYDIAGRLERVTDALGQSRHYAYAKDDRVIGISYPGALQATPAVSFVWDAQRPRLTSMTDGAGTTTYSYHPEGAVGGGKLASELSSSGPAASLTYFYDELGRLDARSIGAGDEIYEYDALGRVSLIDNDLGTFANHYLGNTSQLTQSVVGRVQTGFSYSPNSEDRNLISITVKDGAIQRSVRGYGHDVLGRVVSSGDFRAAWPGNPAVNEQHGYGYDADDRLASLVDTSSNTTLEAFGYDDSGNLLQQVRGAAAWNAGANDNNQLTSVDGVPWTYDLVGNLVDDGQRTYSWDADNRLVKITVVATGASSEFSYDGLGRRIKSVERATPTANPVTMHYTWCGSEVCQKRDATQAVAATYFRQGEVHGATRLYYSRDQLGSVREVLDEAGDIVGSMRHSAYGRTVASSGVLPDKRYAGMFFHEESGLYLTWYRAYDPEAGRWISRDPIGMQGGNNIYAYVRGNPISLIDPLGLADMVLLAPGAPGHTFANNLNPPGVYSVVAHGSPLGVRDGATGMRLSPAELAARIRADPNYKPGTTVEIYACRTGEGDYGQQVANELGANVRAPSQYLFGWESGRFVFAGHNNPVNGYPDMNNLGQHILFTPGGP